MKRQTTALISGVLITLGLMVGASRLRAQPEGTDPGPLTLTVALAGSSTVILGEPVLLRYTVNNTSGQKASVFTADVKHAPLITESFTDGAGKTLAPSVNPIPPRHRIDVLTGWDGLEIAGNASSRWEAVANAYVAFPHPGRYILQVHVGNPYVIGDIDQGAHYVLGGDYTFPLTVTAANPAYLRTTAERLQRRVLQTQDVNVRAMLIKALLSMPESEASASWQTLVKEPKLDGSSLSQIGTALARIHTLRAADILAEMIWSPAQSRDVLSEALPEQHLYEIYDTGNAALRKHIEDLHKQHGAEMSRYRFE